MSREKDFLMGLAELMDEHKVESFDMEDVSSCGCCRGDLELVVDFGRNSTVRFQSNYICSSEFREKGETL
jgi:hypothetical protein